MTDLGHSKIDELNIGIVEITCKDELMYDINQILENHQVLEQISRNRNEALLVCSVAGKYTGITSEATIYISKGPHKNFIKAEAFVIHSKAQRLFANLYLKISKPVVPAAYFNAVEDARNWLLKFREQ